MKLPDEFGTFPFARFTAEEFRYFFAWCARHRVSDIDLTGGSPVSVSRFGRRVRSSAHPLPSSIMMALSVTNGAIVIHTQRLKSDPGGNLLS